MICGSGSFGHGDDDQDKNLEGPCIKTQKRSKRSMIRSFRKKISRENGNKINNTNNPYADRGLDKFYALVAEHEDKKQQIYAKMGSEDVAFVRFVYTDDSKTVKPVVVRVKDKDKNKNKNIKQEMNIHSPKTLGKKSTLNSTLNHTKFVEAVESQLEKEELGKKNGDKKRCNEVVLHNYIDLRKQLPFYYFAVIIVLVLVFLAVSGRSFAILCTSMLWYLHPHNNQVIQGSSSTSKSSSPRKLLKEKKEFGNKNIVHSERPSSPMSGNEELLAHRRSWS